jgi:hypothetical protein
MSSILDLIKRNALPAAVMRTASKGALPLPAPEMLEILVYLTQNPVFAQDAKMTLAGWDPVSATECVASSSSPPEVLGYFWAEQNRRPVLMPALIENSAIAEELLMEMAGTAPREIVSMLLASPRARSSPAVVEALTTNHRLTPAELRELTGEAETPAASADVAESDPEGAAAHRAWVEQHAGELAAEEGKAFELAVADEEPAAAESMAQQEQAAAAAGASEAPPVAGESAPQEQSVAARLAVAALAAQNKRAVREEEEKKLTLLQKIANMSVAERVKTAFTGNKEERLILIRDNARVVQNAVLSSPKLTDPEVETFAAARNVHENVLREIVRNRRFMKNYAVQRNLVNNPKTPLEISLTLVRNLMVYDLKTLQRSRNVPETIRAVAQKLYREKALSGGKTKE